MFAGSIAYVISALEREPVTAKRRPKKRSSERDYTEGLIQNPDDLGAQIQTTFQRQRSIRTEIGRKV